MTLPDLPEVRNCRTSRGDFLDDDTVKSAARVAVLGQTVVESLFSDSDPVDATIRIGKIPFTVIGVMEKKGLDLSGQDQDDRGARGRTRTWCTAGHFVCEECRGQELMGLVEELLTGTRSTGPVEAFVRLRQSHPFPMHGPEHHPLVTAAVLLAYHDLHGEPSWPDILDAVQTAATQLPGGSCGFWGACSAALAVGIAYCSILGSSPTDGEPRAIAHRVVAQLLSRLGEIAAPRCCRGECLLALQAACELSAEMLPHPVSTSYQVVCEQAADNPECIGQACPFAG